ncbi:MAG: family 16 glycoside hydrolase [Melioribacteraceae bacterium]
MSKKIICLLFALLFNNLSSGQNIKTLADVKSDVMKTNYEEVRIREFNVAVQCWTYRKYTFFEALDKIRALGVRYVQAYPGQKLSNEDPETKFNYDLSDDKIEIIKNRLKELNLTIVAFGVVGFPNSESETDKVFNFAKKMGIRKIVTEPSSDDYSLLDKMVKKYNIEVAIHNHPAPNKYANPETVFKNIQNVDFRIGVCGDTGHWLRSGINPVEALRLLKGRVIDVHLKDLNEAGRTEAYDVPFGKGKSNIHDILAELSLQNYRGFLTIEHEKAEDAEKPETAILAGLKYIDGITYYKGFVELLGWWNGRYNKHGWNHYGPGYFELDETTGILKSSGGMGLFWFSAKKFGNFVLDLEYTSHSEKTNSGIFLRVPDFVISDDYIYHSFEIQIDNVSDPLHRTGAVYDAEPVKKDAFKAPGEWNHFRITFEGDKITVELNGQLVNEWKCEPRGKVKDFAKTGFIGLQNHDSAAKVGFRNIFIKELK